MCTPFHQLIHELLYWLLPTNIRVRCLFATSQPCSDLIPQVASVGKQRFQGWNHWQYQASEAGRMLTPSQPWCRLIPCSSTSNCPRWWWISMTSSGSRNPKRSWRVNHRQHVSFYRHAPQTAATCSLAWYSSAARGGSYSTPTTFSCAGAMKCFRHVVPGLIRTETMPGSREKAFGNERYM